MFMQKMAKKYQFLGTEIIHNFFLEYYPQNGALLGGDFKRQRIYFYANFYST